MMIRALGMMSGTSLDGVDAAIVDTDGVRIAGFGPSGFAPWSEADRAILRAGLGSWPGQAGVDAVARLVETGHASLADRFPDAALIGFHGQTLAHDPAARRTHQAGSGAALAEATGRPVVWDFRSEDVRRGGEGAPLVPFFHWACARWAVDQGRLGPRSVAFLNLGGVGNVSWVDPSAAAPEDEGACLAFDTGPANAPLNDLMHRRLGLPQDQGGALALRGRADTRVVEAFLDDPWFARRPPKSLDRDHFAALPQMLGPLSDADAAATLVAVLAASAGAAMGWLPARPSQVLVCGGGRHNRAVMEALGRVLPCPVAPVEVAGLDGDMLEAQAFAWLAVRVLRGLPVSGSGTTGVPEPVCGGRISHPRDNRAGQTKV